MSMHPVGEMLRIVQNNYLKLVDPEFHEDKSQVEVITKALGGVERCVRGYSKREGAGDCLSGIVYRIWNAIKAIFGQSDWQIARRGLKDLMINLPIGPGHECLWQLYNVAFHLDSQNPFDDFNQIMGNIKKIGSEIGNKDLDTILNHFVAVDENRSLRQFFSAPAIQRLMKSNSINSINSLCTIVSCMNQIKNAQSDRSIFINFPGALNGLQRDFTHDFDYLKKVFDDENLGKRSEEILKKPPAERDAEYEAFVRSIPEFAEFIPLLDVSTEELSMLFTFFTDIPSKVDLERHQL